MVKLHTSPENLATIVSMPNVMPIDATCHPYRAKNLKKCPLHNLHSVTCAACDAASNKQQTSRSIYKYKQHNNDRLTAFDPGQPG